MRHFRAPIWCTSGDGGTREVVSTVAESLVVRYALDSARAEGSLIVDEPGECWTPVRENQRREPGGS